MKNKSILTYVRGGVLAVGMLSALACTNGLDSNLANPSALSQEQASNEFIFNGMQLNLANLFLNSTDFGQDVTRMRNLFGSTYENCYTQNSFNGVWQSAYSDLMVNANLLLDKTTENAATTDIEYNAFYQGASKVMKAYAMMTLVDFFGDVPYTEAFDPANFNPVADGGASVYDAAMTLLNEAVTDFGAVTAGTAKPGADLYCDGDEARWRKMANTLKLKWHLNRRLIDAAGSDAAITALVAGGDIISSDADEFVFTYSANSQSNPNTYHPWFYGNYLTSTGPYMSNSYMKELYDGKSTGKDPRIRYYFYRQVNQENTEVNNLTCSKPTYPYTAFPPGHYPPGTAYCQLPEGYWGRDHLNFEGTPPDGLLKTTYGLYPAGGRFDADYGDLPVTKETSPGAGDGGLAAGGRGKGILPIMMYSYVLFMQAEHQLTKPSPNNVLAASLLDQAVKSSINRVINFMPSAVDDSFVPGTAGINAYAAVVQNDFNTGDKLDAIIREYWVALWGNGVEAYNMYRRTGRPLNQQPALAPNPGNFYRSFTYPGVFVIRNNTAVQKPDNKVQVFWDTNPAGFIN